MRIVSLTPSATEIVYALGLGDELVGRSHACDDPPEVMDVPIVTRRGPDVMGRRLDANLLAALEPDLVLADGSDDEPLVDYAEISAAVGGLKRDVTLVALAPQTLEGIFNSISTVGAYTESEYEAVGLVELLRERLAEVEQRVPAHATRRVVVLEGLDPPTELRAMGAGDGSPRRRMGAARAGGRSRRR